MSHRVNFKVYRLGKTIKWNFSAPLINIQRVMRLNYIMTHWIKRALADHHIKIFKFFYSISSDFPFIKIIGYRKIYAYTDRIDRAFNFTLRSSPLLNSNDLFAESVYTAPSVKFKLFRQRSMNRKLKPVREPSKQRKASFKNVLLPLLRSDHAFSLLFKFFLIETAGNSKMSPFLTINWVFDQIFMFNSLTVFALFGAAAEDDKSIHLDFFRKLLNPSSFVDFIMKSIFKVESSTWFKFISSYTYLFLKCYKPSCLSAAELKSNNIPIFDFNGSRKVFLYENLSSDFTRHFFILKKSFTINKTALKQFPQSIFFSDNLNSNSSFLLNILRHYFYISDEKKFVTLHAVQPPFCRARPNYYILLKFKFILIVEDIRKLLKKKFYGRLKLIASNSFFYFYTAARTRLYNLCFNFYVEVNFFWTRNFSYDYKRFLNKIESCAWLSTQIILFVTQKLKIPCSPVAEYLNLSAGWWRSHFFVHKQFNYDTLFYFILSAAEHAQKYSEKIFYDFNYFFLKGSIFKLLKNWADFSGGNTFLKKAFGIFDDFDKLSRKVYKKPLKIFADVDKALSIKIPDSYKDFLSTSSRASSVFSFKNYENNLSKYTKNSFNRYFEPFSILKKKIKNILLLIAKVHSGGQDLFFIKTKSGADLLKTLKALLDNFLVFFDKHIKFAELDKMSYQNFSFVYFEKIIKILESIFFFWNSAQAVARSGSTFLKTLNFIAQSPFKKNFICRRYNFLFNSIFIRPINFFSMPESYISFSHFSTSSKADEKVFFLLNRRTESLLVVESLFSLGQRTIRPVGLFLTKKIFNNFFFKEKILVRDDFINFASISSPAYLCYLNFKLLFFGDFSTRNINKIFFSKNIFYSTSFSFSFSVLLSTLYRANLQILGRAILPRVASLLLTPTDVKKFIPSAKSLGSNLLKKNYAAPLKFNPFNLIDSTKPILGCVDSYGNFFSESIYNLNITSAFFKVFGINYEIVFYPIHRVFQDNSRFQFLISQASDFLRAYVSRNPYVLYWLNEFIVIFYASIATRSTKALSQFMADRFKIEYYWNQPAAFMFSVIRSVVLSEFGIAGIKIGFHGKFGGQERAYRLNKIWGINPCLRNGFLTGSHSSSRCHSKYGITDIHIWLVFF